MNTYKATRIDCDWQGNQFLILLFEDDKQLAGYYFKTALIERFNQECEKLTSLGWSRAQ